jgi:tetratricopeptide (TPR) repeat protein
MPTYSCQGSINQIGGITRLNAQLIDSKTEEVFKSFQLDGSTENIIRLADSLTTLVKDFLIVTILKKEISFVHQYYLESEKMSLDPESFNLYFKGLKAFLDGNYQEARKAFLSAIEINSNFGAPLKLLPFTYGNEGNFEEAKKWATILLENIEKLSQFDAWWAKYTYAYYFETPEKPDWAPNYKLLGMPTIKPGNTGKSKGFTKKRKRIFRMILP